MLLGEAGKIWVGAVKMAPKKELQDKIVAFVEAKFTDYDNLLKQYRQKWYSLFRATYVFETERKGEGKSTIFFPKAYEQIEKLSPRITGNSPKFVINLNLPANTEVPEANMTLNAQAAQMGLNYFWRVGNCQKKARTWSKAGLLYGIAFAKTAFKRKTIKTQESSIVESDEGLKLRTVEKEIVAIEFPTFEVPDILDLWFDPRIENVEDMDGIIENIDDVSLADVLARKEDFFNLKELQRTPGTAYSSNSDNLKQDKFNVQGVVTTGETKNKVNFRVFYGLFSETGKPEDEKLIKATISNGILIGYEDLEVFPWEKWVCSEVPNQGVGVGIVEPIQKLQDAYNLTRNQRFENVSLVINRMWTMKTGAGLDPRRLQSKAGNVIPVRDHGDLMPIQTPDVTASAFNEANAINTEIQTTLGTIDTTQDSGSGGFTNLATGQKIRWNEYNVRFKAIKTNFEEALGRLGEKMLMMVGKEATKNPVIQDDKTKQFFETAKTAFDQTSDYYTVAVVADSTAMDSIENKREEALGFGQLAIAYKAQGVNIPMDKVWADIVETFSKEPTVYSLPAAPQEATGRAPTAETIENAMPPKNPADQLNQSLANV